MRDAVLAELPRAGIVIKAAAVADFRPAAPLSGKLRKEELAEGAGLALELVRNPDILAEICRDKGRRVVVGFAAEHGDPVESARRKLVRKGCDLIVANDVSAPGVGFDHDTNAVTIFSSGGEVRNVPLAEKATIARAVLDEVVACRHRRF
jgi:phosphopantothenoylcysteine decarboxylase/phosphopantothenate--cysteine ligase